MQTLPPGTPHGDLSPRAETETPPFVLCCPEVFADPDLTRLLSADAQVGGTITLAAAQARLGGGSGGLGGGLTRLLLIYEDAPRFMARHMLQADAPAESEQAWLRTVRPLLQLVRQNRRRVVLMRAGMIRAYPEVFAAQLGFSQATARAIAALPRPAEDPLKLLIAEYCRLQSADMRRLSAELDAGNLDLTNGAPDGAVDADSAYRGLGELEQQIFALRSERDTLNAQVDQFDRQLQARTELHSQDMETLRADLAGKEAEIARLAAELAQSDSLRSEQKLAFDSERDTMMQMIQQVQKDLETRYAELRDASDRLREQRELNTTLSHHNHELKIEALRVTEKKDEVEAWIHGILQSKSYRMMAPLRWLRSALRRG